jgi:hypothetical protein
MTDAAATELLPLAGYLAFCGTFIVWHVATGAAWPLLQVYPIGVLGSYATPFIMHMIFVEQTRFGKIRLSILYSLAGPFLETPDREPRRGSPVGDPCGLFRSCLDGRYNL